MKRILITGVNSYVGNEFAEWLKQYPNDYTIDKVSLRDNNWKKIDLSNYDTILHVAGIAHQKETKKNAEIYYKINRDLTYEVAKEAKKNKVKRFVFLSTMSVYGLDEGVINTHTPLKPISHYGKSKFEAEKLIDNLSDNLFKVSIIRPPMIYGKGCKGNYQRLRKIALKTPVFPNVGNKRSMIYIDNLSEFIKKIIDNSNEGVYCPQNKEYVNTSRLVKEIALLHNRSIKFTHIFNYFLKISNTRVIKKVFGNLVYERTNKEKYFDNFIDFKDTIKMTEK